MVPPKDNIVSCKVVVKNRGICQSGGSLASCIALGQVSPRPDDTTGVAPVRTTQPVSPRPRVVQDSWFAVHARIACMTDGQSARFAWNTACDPRAY